MRMMKFFNYIEMIQIEYHYGYDKLKEKLERVGFKVKIYRTKRNLLS